MMFKSLQIFEFYPSFFKHFVDQLPGRLCKFGLELVIQRRIAIRMTEKRGLMSKSASRGEA
ncbi:hypothetical protein FHW67_002717 [Herbaspirillum sp. Sphag1AN]|nr:hypothetical protein [Herbaspirillum sp. Sphag1AN]MBB3246531.1 hypothetical protein [Herbaspirillum sp. Sphag64]